VFSLYLTITEFFRYPRNSSLFRLHRGEVKNLVISKFANFNIDLQKASVAIEISGTFGNRHEEAQHLGRILRLKSDSTMAHFYTNVTRETVDKTFAANRQRFLTEQGDKYEILYER
jgi:DNA excision repair protein ERCC-3